VHRVVRVVVMCVYKVDERTQRTKKNNNDGNKKQKVTLFAHAKRTCTIHSSTTCCIVFLYPSSGYVGVRSGCHCCIHTHNLEGEVRGGDS
jgi:hypothetical protein